MQIPLSHIKDWRVGRLKEKCAGWAHWRRLGFIRDEGAPTQMELGIVDGFWRLDLLSVSGERLERRRIGSACQFADSRAAIMEVIRLAGVEQHSAEPSARNVAVKVVGWRHFEVIANSDEEALSIVAVEAVDGKLSKRTPAFEKVEEIGEEMLIVE